jgi:hypothetical protein
LWRLGWGVLFWVLSPIRLVQGSAFTEHRGTKLREACRGPRGRVMFPNHIRIDLIGDVKDDILRTSLALYGVEPESGH